MSDSLPGDQSPSARSTAATVQDPPFSPSPSPVDALPAIERIAHPELGDLLSRPATERAREYRYRFGQSVVFGLPVIALQLWGDKLGGREALRWTGVFQALLAGWVIYVAAAGMLFEGILLLGRRRVTGDLVCASMAVAVCLLSALRLIHVLIGPSRGRPVFHWAIVILGTWSALRWWQFSRRVAILTRGSGSR
jgi:hypothetical protein